MASALQPEIWRPNMPGVRELITYSISSEYTVEVKKSLCSVTVVRKYYAGLGQKVRNRYATSTPSLVWPDSTLTERNSLVNCHRTLCSGIDLVE